MENESTKKEFKISFCIVCMNRTDHLKKTLVYNILDNIDYPNLEIVLLNYNSNDDMEDWVGENLLEYINSGKLVYYKTFEPLVFSHSHSKNLAFKLATGDIVCNINADIFLGTKFAHYINNDFRSSNDIFIIQSKGNEFPAGASGIICVSKDDFIALGGFDERMLIYGWEDWDLVNRLRFYEKRPSYVTDPSFFKEIPHIAKYDSTVLKSKIKTIYIDRSSPEAAYHTTVLILFTNLTFKKGILINYAVTPPENHPTFSHSGFQFEIENRNWETGTWQIETEEIMLLFQGNAKVEKYLEKSQDRQSILFKIGKKENTLYEVKNGELLDFLLYFEMDYNNRLLMIGNMENRKTKVNNNVFGQGKVYKNFDYNTPILV